MKIAIASIDGKEDGDVSPQAGRAPFYLIYEDGKLIETIKNPFAFGGGGAGFGVAKMVADKGVEKIIAGRFGPNMVAGLEERGVKHEEAQGKIVDVIEK
jgi:predicted Fe-Mo cluster-binding NifX family protein